MGGPIIINIPPVEEWTLTELRHTCKRNKIKGYTKMSKDELVSEVKAIVQKRNQAAGRGGVVGEKRRSQDEAR